MGQAVYTPRHSISLISEARSNVEAAILQAAMLVWPKAVVSLGSLNHIQVNSQRQHALLITQLARLQCAAWGIEPRRARQGATKVAARARQAHHVHLRARNGLGALMGFLKLVELVMTAPGSQGLAS